MKKKIVAIILVLSPCASSQETNDINAIWNDPTFKKQFIASYGINADIEPRVSPEEIAVLEKIRPLMADNLPKAESTVRESIKADSSAILDFTLAGIQYQQDKMTESVENYQKAVAKFPSFRRAWRNLGMINARNGKYDAAINAFTRMIELGGGDAYSYGFLGFSYASKQDYQAAEIAYRNALLLQPENTEWRLGLTRSVFRQEKFEDAVSLLNVLIERFPEKADFWWLQAEAFIRMKQPLRAAENLEALDRLGKATIDSLYSLGDIYLNETLPDLALRSYRRAIEVDGKQSPTRAIRAAEGLLARGNIATARAMTSSVRKSWETRLEETERRKLLKLESRLSMAEGEGNPETAKVLEEIVKLDPLDGEALMLLGQHYVRAADPDRGILYYERAASIDAFEAQAKLRHAQTLVGMSRYADALPLLRRVQELKPREDVARYLEQVERISKARR